MQRLRKFLQTKVRQVHLFNGKPPFLILNMSYLLHLGSYWCNHTNTK